MQFYSLTAAMLLLVGQVHTSDIYQSLRIYGTDPTTLEVLHTVGVPLDHVRIKKDVYIDVISSSEQTMLLEQNGLDFDVLINDMTRYFLDRNVPEVSRDFELGSMLGNYTLSEVEEKMDSLAILFPNYVSAKDSIGASMEGRTIWAFKISDNPDQDEDEPGVLYTGLTHAREPLGMMNQFYFVQWLCENYTTNNVAEYLVNNRELWFIPVINPDGYVYNESIAPNGGGMHRKNRRDTNCGNGTQRGVDLNRNYGYEWGADNFGSSPDSCSATFRGDSAFSEPETQAVRDFILDHEFSNVLHYHSYSNVLIHSWGDGTLPAEPDLTTLREIGWEMSKYNGYQVGTGYETIGYGVNGDAVDWSYGTAGLISYTPEVGSYQDYFWPPENRVIPLCEDQLYSNQIFGLVGSADYSVYTYNTNEQQSDTIQFNITIQNRGLKDSDGDVMVDAVTYTNASYILDYSENIGSLNARETVQISISLVFPGSSENGMEVGFLLTLNDNSSFVRTDTLTTIVGVPTSVFSDDAEVGLTQWDTYDWGLTTNSYNGVYSFTDSPQGNYSDYASTAIRTSNAINLIGLNYPTARFAAKWNIENNYDFVKFQASTDGTNWTSLPGIYTENGSGFGTQNPNDVGYDGESDWIEETVDLSDYINESAVYLQFILTSDGGVTSDGFYFDDFSIQGYLNYLPGDLDDSGDVDIFDVLNIIELILSENELNDYQQATADVNFDGEVNIYDVLKVVDIIMSN